MLAKPDESVFPQPAELVEVWTVGQQRIDKMKQPIGRRHLVRLWKIIIEAAAAALRTSLGSSRGHITSAAVSAWFDHWCRTEPFGAAATTLMRQSYRVATAQAVPNVGWALGAAWRGLYPALVRRISHGGLASEAWPKFHQVAIEMERIAFGPPAENLGRVLALVDAGIVDLRFLTSAPSMESGNVAAFRGGGNTLKVDRVVDAVLPSPYQIDRGGPVANLLDDSIIQRLHENWGIEVDPSGKPVVNGRSSPPGLSILGRCTEGCILGNDSLSRTLHDQPGRWADRVTERIRERVNL